MKTEVIICTLRDNKGATGGPGGVVYMIKKTLGINYCKVPISYRFNPVKFGGRFKYFINQLLFKIRCYLERDKYYIVHDIDAGSVLSRLKKTYSLVYHNQGPIVQELLNLGRKLNEKEKKVLFDREREAFMGAKSIHFPSLGAKEMYFNNNYATCKESQVRVGEPLYNTIPVEKGTKVEGLEKENDKITFFSLGTLTDAKGQDRAIDFVEKYIKSNPHNKVRYIVVGRGPLRELIHNRAKDILEKNSNFEFIYYPVLKHSEVMYVHEISDVYLMLHRISIFDFATLEAMSASSAVVLSPVGGNKDFNKSNNILFVDDKCDDNTISSLTIDNIEKMKILNLEVFNQFFSELSFKQEYEKLIDNQVL